jgi:peptide/nickel transport system substrate-binding protein
MRYHFFVLISIFSILLFSCGSEETKQKNAIGGKLYGGEFKFMSSEKVINLFPLSSVDIYAQRLNSQIYQPLLTLDLQSMVVVPSIAESYVVSEDAKTFTFKIRKGIKFQNDDCFNGKGRALTVEDVKYTLEMACSGLKINKMSYLLVNRIEGARNFYSNSKNSLPKSGVSGIRIVNDSTLEIKLNESFIGFDKVLTHTNLGIFPHEAYEKYGRNIAKHPVGTGPFMLEKMDASGVILKRNDNFWKKDEFGNQLPFLDRVIMIYAKDKKSELLAFRTKEIDLVLEIPVEEIENILGSLQDAQAGKNVKHKVESKSSMGMNYVAFACQSIEFKNPNVRKAFNLAIDRNEIVEKWLLGEGWAAQNGFVPKLDNYPNEKINGDRLNVSKAKALLVKAGYPEGKGFPVLDFYVNAIEGSAPHKMCKGVAAQIKQNLGIDLKIKLCTFEERERAILSGKAKIWRSGWIADYPDAENFLSLFYSGSIKDNATSVNAFKFHDKAYDALFEKAIKELDETKRNALFANCDQMIVDEAAVMPIMTDDFMVMINARIRDFQTNSMENLDFSAIYIKEPRKKN